VQLEVASGAKKSPMERTVGDFLITPTLFAKIPDYHDSHYALICKQKSETVKEKKERGGYWHLPIPFI
jgi:hypothetical protein